MDDESWDAYRKLVLSEMERVSDAVKQLEHKMDKKLTKVSDDIVALKIKAGLWGFVCGLIPAAFGVLGSQL